MNNYIIIGGPGTGKSTLADKLVIQDPHRVTWSTDELKGLEWSQMSDRVAKQIDTMAATGSWVMEGCAAVRGLRKWLQAHPDTPVPATIILLTDAMEQQTPKQAGLHKGVMTIWSEILPVLLHLDTIIWLRADAERFLNADS